MVYIYIYIYIYIIIIIHIELFKHLYNYLSSKNLSLIVIGLNIFIYCLKRMNSVYFCRNI